MRTPRFAAPPVFGSILSAAASGGLRIKTQSLSRRKISERLRVVHLLCLCGLIGTAQLRAAGTIDPSLPGYRAEQAVAGELNSLGDNTMDGLMNDWLGAFQNRQPKVQKGAHWEFLGTALAVSALMFDLADIAPINRELWPSELLAYAKQFGAEMMKEPLFIRVAGGAFAPQDQAGAVCIYVNASNPLKQISYSQLDAIFGRERRRGRPAEVRTWGQLGLTGDWAGRPIVPVGFPIHTGMSGMAVHFQRRILQNGPWADQVEEAANIAAILKRIASTPGAIGFGGILDVPGVKTLALGEADSGPFYTAAPETVADHTYPFSRYIFLAVNKRPGAPLPPVLKEFLSFVLSREGQEIVARHKYFFPLNVADAAAERAKLQGPAVPLDPALPSYRPVAQVGGAISSVGSSRMRGLMDGWMKAFRQVQPRVRKGDRWEHYGTSLGFHALFLGETDVAPMERQAWPVEGFGVSADLDRVHKTLVEIRVARANSTVNRYVYIRLNHRQIPEQVKEFMRFILSREGQERVIASGYLPLTAAEAGEEIARLE
jgi:ABC-type phosphate transport system substrate-binding protein